MNTSIIIPIHELNDKILALYDNAMKSVIGQIDVEGVIPVVLVYPKKLHNELITHNKKYLDNHNISILYVKNEGETDYQSQVNLAVETITADYFTVLEFDDELSTSFMRNQKQYIDSYGDVGVFMTMIVEVDGEENALKFTNEMVWSQQFIGENGELGHLNGKMLQQYSDFKLSGAVIKKQSFVDLGMYKKNIKLTFMYEYLLRTVNNGVSVMVIPKLGYKHLSGRENSLFDIYSKTMSMKERKFWFDTAIKESNFTNDRVITIPNFEDVK